MQKQAVEIQGKESPIVETGIEAQIAKNNSMTDTASESGLIKFINTKKFVLYTNSTRKKLYIKNKSLLIKAKNKLKSRETNVAGTVKKRFFKKNKESNSNIYINNFILRNKNDWTKKGEILSDKKKENKGKLSLGKNLLIGYLSWKGYNFEDSIIINEKLINEDSFTSFTIKKQVTFLINNKVGEVGK